MLFKEMFIVASDVEDYGVLKRLINTGGSQYLALNVFCPYSNQKCSVRCPFFEIENGSEKERVTVRLTCVGNKRVIEDIYIKDFLEAIKD